MKALRWFRNLTLITLLGALPNVSFSQISVGISVNVAPPELPVYEQPVCPAPNYIWTPGYWAWGGPDGYYWVPGTWVEAPAVGLLWTPGYWGWNNGSYLWNTGYWGPEVGFYGGVDYGFGYGGNGFYGGRWRGGYFSYNTAVVRVNTTIIHNTYVDRTVIVNRGNRVSFNGGRGGIEARPSPAQMQAARAKRFGPVETQRTQERFAHENKANWASENHGTPRYAALQRPAKSAADFDHAVPARGYRPVSETRSSGTRPAEAGRTARETRPGNTPSHETRPAERPATRPETRPEAKPERMTPARSESRPAARTEARPETRSESRPAAKPEARTEARPAARMEAKPAARTETRTESRPAPAPRATPKPAEHSEPRAEGRPAPAARRAPEEHAAPKAESRPASSNKPAGEKKPE